MNRFIRALALPACLVVGAPTALAAPLTAIVGGHVHPVSSPPIPNGLVIVEGEQIRYVGPAKPLPPGATIIDASGKVVTPGLIDAITQLGAIEIELEASTVDSELETQAPVRAALYLGEVLDLRSTLIGVARRQGVTGALSVPTGGLVAGRSAFIELAEPTSGVDERSFVTGPIAVHANLGSSGAKSVGGSRAAALGRLTELLDDTRQFAKNRAAFERNNLRRLSVHRLELEAMVPVTERKLPLFVSVSRAADILAVLALAERERIEVVVVGGEEAWLVAPQLAKAKVSVILHPLDNLPAKFEGRLARQDAAARLAEAGVTVLISTFSSHNAGGLRFVLGNAVRAGLNHEAALAAATLAPARVLGLSRTLGALQGGLRADLVVWTGDPFEPQSHAERVMIRGVFQPTENRQTRLRARHQARLGLGGETTR